MNPTMTSDPTPPEIVRHWRAQQPSPQASAAAQQRLHTRLQAARDARPPRRRVLRGPAFAALAAGLVAALLFALPTFTPSGGGVAFADVQRYLAGFRTVVMHVEARRGDASLWTMDVAAERDGRVRVDVAQMTTLVDPGAGEVLTLMHGPRRYFRVPVDPQAAREDAMSWLDELREFQGIAQRLPDTREIRGVPAQGFRLRLAQDAPPSEAMELWVAIDDGRPLSLTMGGEGGMTLDYDFRFDVDIAPGRLTLQPPPDYTEVGVDAPASGAK